DVDGIEVMRSLRQQGIATPVLIISALGEIDDRVRGLRAGGDDYLTKPFSFVELLARVEALARRSDTVIKETVLRVGDLELDLVSRTASRRGRCISLLPREFQLLEYLVRNAGRVVSRTMLLQHVWDLHFDPTTNIIDVYVGRVRRKVDDRQSYPLIHTVRGVGYYVRALGSNLTLIDFQIGSNCHWPIRRNCSHAFRLRLSVNHFVRPSSSRQRHRSGTAGSAKGLQPRGAGRPDRAHSAKDCRRSFSGQYLFAGRFLVSFCNW